jgi:hypothetical protein
MEQQTVVTHSAVHFFIPAEGQEIAKRTKNMHTTRASGGTERAPVVTLPEYVIAEPNLYPGDGRREEFDG